MGAGLLNLIINNGDSDKYFTGNPKITFFKTIYRQHTNFGLETVRQDFNKVPLFGTERSVKISQNGDLINKVYLCVELPKIKKAQPGLIGNSTYAGWINALGNHICDFIEIRIGGKTIDTLYPQWLDIYSSLFLPIDKQKSYNYLTLKSETDISYLQNGLNNQVVMLPLTFWFFDSYNALPLCSLHYHEITFHLKFNSVKNLIKSDEVLNNPIDDTDNPLEISDAYLLVDYIFLDKEERRNLVEKPIEMLIEQTQYLGKKTINPNSNVFDYKIEHKHNLKEIYFMFQPHSMIQSNSQTGNAPNEYNYKDPLEPTIRVEICNKVEFNICGNQKHPPISSKLYLGINNFNYHTNISTDFIYSYSFALNPEEHQPSGTINFSNVDNSYMKFYLNSIPDYCDLYFFSRNYNILIIQSGMAGQKWYD